MEDWLPIYDNPMYAVSNLGNVKNRLTDKLLKVYPSRLLTIRRVSQRHLANIGNLLSQIVYIPTMTVNGKRRRKYYINDLKHAYHLARVLIENNNPARYVE